LIARALVGTTTSPVRFTYCHPMFTSMKLSLIDLRWMGIVCSFSTLNAFDILV